MRLSSTTESISGLGASVLVGVSTLLPTVSVAEESVAGLESDRALSPNTEAELIEQQDYLAENPLCRLASELIESEPVLSPTVDLGDQVPSKFSNFVTGFFQQFVGLVGLDHLLPRNPVPTSSVAVVSTRISGFNGSAAASDERDSNVSLVSNRSEAGQTISADEYELWVKGNLIANIRSQEKVNLLAQRIERLVESASFNASAIAPRLHHGQPAIAMGDQILFVIDTSITRAEANNYEILAIRWANNLRIAFDVLPLDLVTAQVEMYQIEETSDSLDGLASWYGPYFHGRLTANGETYDQYAFTAAHPSMPLDTYLKITNLHNEKSVIIRLNDRGPYIKPRNLDLSLGAARCLNSVETGVIPYKATIMQRRPTLAAEEI